MTAIADYCKTIRAWLAVGEEVYPDDTVASWVHMAEEALSKKLRIKDMVQIDTAVFLQDRYLLPADWRELDFVRVLGGGALRYVPRDDFYNPDFAEDQKNCYTLTGNYLIVGGVSSTGREIELSYYQDIPPLGDENTYMVTKYPTLFTLKTLHIASMYAIEDDRGPMWEGQSDDMIGAMNLEHQMAKSSGSRLSLRHGMTTSRKRSFG
jgi:hypothetical protein